MVVQREKLTDYLKTRKKSKIQRTAFEMSWRKNILMSSNEFLWPQKKVLPEQVIKTSQNMR